MNDVPCIQVTTKTAVQVPETFGTLQKAGGNAFRSHQSVPTG